jgi:4-amino-4-deoxy-L-arabinose transferase-like glycosyltransferase
LYFVLLAFLLRIWALDAKGLAYDEAATALMARATPEAIIRFHWEAAFEHPPFWQLLMYGWSQLAGQSEFALRFLAALAGVVQIPLVWQLARRLEIRDWGLETKPYRFPSLQSPVSSLQSPVSSLPMVSVLFVTLSPILVFYSQEARMYTIVVALALASLWATAFLIRKPTARRAALFVLVNGVMTGYHYYSVLLVGAEIIVLGWVALRARLPYPTWVLYATAVITAVAPLAGWMLFAPGFGETLTIVLASRVESQPGPGAFLDGLWRDLSFGAIRWQPAHAWVGYLSLPLVMVGVVRVAPRGLAPVPTDDKRMEMGLSLLLVAAVMIPLLVSVLFFRTLATRYILFVAPLLCILAALGLNWINQLDWRLGGLWLIVALMVVGAGLLTYLGPYRKSDYRAMAQSLLQQFDPEDGILLEAPRQHLLAKYYLPEGLTFYTAPHVELPDYWPVNAPPVVPEEMDDRLQEYLRRHRTLWLILTAEDEVDKGEFVPKYLTAVSFRQECEDWLDVRLCRFVSPHATPVQATATIGALYGGQLLLERADLAIVTERDGRRFLLVTLYWLAEVEPTLDYRVTLRLLDEQGAIVSQLDEYPIGPLLPPTTWQAGDAKPGYMALPAPAEPGVYRAAVGVYDRTTGAVVSYRTNADTPLFDLIAIGTIEQDYELTIRGGVTQ